MYFLNMSFAWITPVLNRKSPLGKWEAKRKVRTGPARWRELKQLPELFFLSGYFWVSCEYYIHYHAEKRNLIPTRNWVVFFPPYCSDFWFIICPHRTSFIITPVWRLIWLCLSLSGKSYFFLWHQIFLVPSSSLCWDLAKLQSQRVLLKCGCASPL